MPCSLHYEVFKDTVKEDKLKRKLVSIGTLEIGAYEEPITRVERYHTLRLKLWLPWSPKAKELEYRDEETRDEQFKSIQKSRKVIVHVYKSVY